MKFSELPERHANALREFYVKIVEIKSNESQEVGRAALRLLVLGNGAGIAILAAFMGVIVEKGDSISDLITPLIWFLGGATLAALIYLPLVAVAYDAASHIGTIVEQLFKDQIDLEKMQGYGFSKRGVRIVNALMLGSLLCFLIGVVLCVFALQNRT